MTSEMYNAISLQIEDQSKATRKAIREIFESDKLNHHEKYVLKRKLVMLYEEGLQELKEIQVS